MNCNPNIGTNTYLPLPKSAALSKLSIAQIVIGKCIIRNVKNTIAKHFSNIDRIPLKLSLCGCVAINGKRKRMRKEKRREVLC